MTTNVNARLIGLLASVLGGLSFIAVLFDLFRVDPMVHGQIRQASGTIVESVLGNESGLLRRRAGYHMIYAFDVGPNQRYRGSYFSRSHRHAEQSMGQPVRIDYRVDDPKVNRLAGHVPSNKGFVYFFALLYGVIFLVGAVMFITGRDFISDWKAERRSTRMPIVE